MFCFLLKMKAHVYRVSMEGNSKRKEDSRVCFVLDDVCENRVKKFTTEFVFLFSPITNVRCSCHEKYDVNLSVCVCMHAL